MNEHCFEELYARFLLYNAEADMFLCSTSVVYPEA